MVMLLVMVVMVVMLVMLAAVMNTCADDGECANGTKVGEEVALLEVIARVEDNGR